MPGIAVARESTELVKDLEVTFVGTGKDIERKVLARTPFPYLELPVRGKRTAVRALALPLAVLSARGLLRKISADAVVGLGGYGSVATAFAARSLGLPVFALEQNVLCGRATRMVAYAAREVLVSFDETARRFSCPARVRVVGNPVRRGIGALGREQAARMMGLDARKTTLLVLGGSQGATAINELVMQTIGALAPAAGALQVVHQTGSRDFERVRRFYEENRPVTAWKVAPFFTDMAAVYGVSDVAFARAGATTLAELALAGIGALLVPYPYATDDHQWANAKLWQEAGAAFALRQSEATAAKVLELLRSLVCDVACRSRMAEAATALARPDAARAAADRIVGSLFKKRQGPFNHPPS